MYRDDGPLGKWGVGMSVCLEMMFALVGGGVGAMTFSFDGWYL